MAESDLEGAVAYRKIEEHGHEGSRCFRWYVILPDCNSAIAPLVVSGIMLHVIGKLVSIIKAD
jgi:hypothetical protein